MTRRLRITLLALVCALIALLSTAPAAAHIAPLDTPPSALSRAADSRPGLNGEIAYCTYYFSLREPRLASGNSVVGLRRASDPTLRWKARPREVFGGTEVYDMRARQWVPELGAFLSIDEYAFHDVRSTLWGWPRQNPVRYRDPSGRRPEEWDPAGNEPGVREGNEWAGSIAIAAILLARAPYLLLGAGVANENQLWMFGLGGNPLGAARGASAGETCEAGAGGNWPRMNETPGGAVGQSTPMSCGAACGEMLSGIPQETLIDTIGAPTSAEELGRAIGMRGGMIDADLKQVTDLGHSWAAELRDGPGGVSHLVVVDGMEGGNVLIRDPWGGGTTYQMTQAAFENAWTGRGVIK